MLRVVAVAIGAALLTAGVAMAVLAPGGWAAAIECAVLGILILVGTLLEKHYRSRRPVTDAAWQTTGERFLDPSTGQFVEVHYNSQTGERSYEPSESASFPKI